MKRWIALVVVVALLGLGAMCVVVVPDLVVLGLYMLVLPGLVLMSIPTLFLWSASITGLWLPLRLRLDTGKALVVAVLTTVALFATHCSDCR